MAEWLSYEQYDKDGKAEVFIDFDASLDVPEIKSRFTACGILTVSGFETAADGTPSDAAATELYDLQGKIEGVLGDDGAVAACIASAGKYRYVVYAATKPIGLTLAPLTPPTWSSDETWETDTSWNVYATWSLAGDEREAARDCMQLDDLKNRVADLPDPATFTFDFEFADGRTARQADTALERAGYVVHDTFGDTEGEDYDSEPIVRVDWTGTPDADALTAARKQICAIAGEYGGKYLGWGCEADLEVTP